MKQSKIYLLLCIIGVGAPWLFILGFFNYEKASIPLFFTSIFANHVSSAVAADLLVSGLVFFTFLFFEGKRLGLKHLWVYILATLFVGLSFGLPLFFYQRARVIENGG
jgi:hypothetical protein